MSEGARRRGLGALLVATALGLGQAACVIGLGPGGSDPDGGTGDDAGPGADGAGADGGEGDLLPPSCQGLVNHSHGTCVDTWSQPALGPIEFEDDVDAAILALGQPSDLFDGEYVKPDKRDAYAALLAAELGAQGLCAVWNGGELYVRDRIRDYNELLDLYTQQGRPRAALHYQCERSDLIPGSLPGYTCALPPSSNEACGGAGNNLGAEVTAIVDEVIAEEEAKGAASEIIDFEWKTLYERGWRLWDDGYPFIERVARVANERGYCVASSRWKWIDLKATNELSEKYSLVTHQALPEEADDPALRAACLADGILPSCEFIIVKAEETCRPADF